MRIVIDLQGAQSSGSRNRGIGRYTLSLAQAIIRNKGPHEVLIVLNSLFPETIEPIRFLFDKLLPQENIRVWHAAGPVCHIDVENIWRRKTAELSRESFIASLSPDMVYITSLFEGLTDDAITSVGLLAKTVPTAVTLYDLIPLINRSPYLDNPVVESWYENKLDQLRRSKLLLAISESSRQEGIKYLGFQQEMSINVGTAADPQFKRIDISNITARSVRDRYGLPEQFVMYTGGIDHRKNIEGLIRAFALLPKSLREKHQLAIVCSVQPESRRLLEKLAKQHGLAPEDMILTGFVPEEDLIALYHLCKVFVFPSWHEGFGLPALEAMSCGAAVIAANTSSLPEVVGNDAALFDPHNDNSIANKIEQVLTDEVFRTELIQHGLVQAKKFSWDESAKLTIAAFERHHKNNEQIKPKTLLPLHRPRLAYISPLPKERSGIADYSAELLPELARHYQIDVIVDQQIVIDPWINENCSVRGVEWFVGHAHLYDRVLYHFGNSHYHQHMFELLERIPGVVVLHDFFLSGITAYMAHQKWVEGINGTWEKSLYQSHGYGALIDFAANRDVQKTVNDYPCNKVVLENPQGVIVHSENSRRLAARWLGDSFAKDWSVVPLLRVASIPMEQAEARRSLGLQKDAFIVCSFGLMGPSKQNRRLLDAWLASPLSKDKRCHLVFVGENHVGEYGADLTATIRNSGIADRIRITGWTDTLQFRQYLSAADIGVQLRTLSRGETSAAVLDCMNYGLPTIVNANGSMADLPNDAVLMLPDEFNDADLKKAIENLWNDENKRRALSARAREVILTQHAPRTCADQYAETIERFYERALSGKEGLVKSIAKVEGAPADENAWLKLAQDIDSNQNENTIKQLLVDVSGLVLNDSNISGQSLFHDILLDLLTNPPKGFKVEPVYAIQSESGYRYARQFTLSLLNCSIPALADEVVTAFNGDIFFGLAIESNVAGQRTAYIKHLRCIGVHVYFIVDDLLSDICENFEQKLNIWKSTLAQTDGIVCTEKAVFDEFSEWLTVYGPKRERPLKLSWFTVRAELGTNNTSKEIAPKISYLPLSKNYISQNLIDIMLRDKWITQWTPDNILRYLGNDGRFGTHVGKRIGRKIESTNQAGILLFGPYVTLAPGNYQVVIRGAVGRNGLAGARMEVIIDKNNQIFGKADLSVPDKNGGLVTMTISLDVLCIDIEVRVYVETKSDLIISQLDIIPIPELNKDDISTLLKSLPILKTDGNKTNTTRHSKHKKSRRNKQR
jgi:glycosyltransferase involved in cell wall biosynthesis